MDGGEDGEENGNGWFRMRSGERPEKEPERQESKSRSLKGNDWKMGGGHLKDLPQTHICIRESLRLKAVEIWNL